MRIFMTGGTGFLGQALVEGLVAAGHEVTVLTRRAKSGGNGRVSFVEGNPLAPGPWQGVAASHDGFVNLAGASIFCRWTEEIKQELRDSRVLTTRNLVTALAAARERPAVLLNASAVGFYGPHGDEVIDEKAGSGTDFLGSLTAEWEETAFQAREKGARVVTCRFGVVLGKNGGALGQMLPAFRLGLGSPLGSGQQWFPWIHIKDLVAILLFLLAQNDIKGPVNCVAPQQLRNVEFSRALASALHRPFILPAVPAFALRLALGEMAEVLLKGQRVVPRQLLDAGFQFRFGEIGPALRDLVG